MVETAAKRVKLESKEPDISDDLSQKIAKQIDYYFSDVNLVRDKFMQEQLGKNDNCVKLSVLATFVRLAQLTKDEDTMIKALKNYNSEYMELDEDKRQIRRKKPIPDREEYKKELEKRTVHISGFPDSALFETLHKYCGQYGEVESLNMRHHFKSKQFKGCIHVVFKDESAAKKVLDSEVLMFKDRELRKESMEQYHKRKEEIAKKRRDHKKPDKKKEKTDNKEEDTVVKNEESVVKKDEGVPENDEN